ncbi:hypothetical protein LEP1GSC088_0720 [Leptospira interrogans str. L1207]|nr:hypothetical protein LEP1GSC088_0720 [Leptospira interrogans str. L1207]
MNAQSIRKKVNRLNEMILAGNVIEAFQEFYHPAVVNAGKYSKSYGRF